MTDTFENNEFSLERENDNPETEAVPAAEPAVPEDAPVVEEVQPRQEQPQESAPHMYETARQAEPYSYRGAGTGRKESPFADGPYTVNRPTQPQDGYRYQSYYEPPRKPKKVRTPKKHRGFWKAAVAAVLTVALVVSSCLTTASVVNNRWEDRTEDMERAFSNEIDRLQAEINKSNAKPSGESVSGSPVSAEGGLTPAQVYAQNLDAVVAISCVVSNGYTKGTSRGSGFIISADGYVITNHHVINNAVSINVVMDNGTEMEAKLIGSDSFNDLAVLKVEETDLPCVTLGSSTNLIVGDQVVAIGNPLGVLTSTMTVGYVSGKDRTVSTDGVVLNMLQTDAAINPGNSGGPLFNMKGEVIGITTAKYSGMTSSGASIEGVGFAVPIDDVLDEIEDLIGLGYIRGGYLGVIVSDLDAETAAVAKAYDLPVGAYVRQVDEGSSAHRAGIEVKDIIIGIGEYEVTSISDLTKVLRNFEPGETTTIRVFRRGGELTLDITMGEKPQEPEAAETVPQEPSAAAPDQGKTEQELFEEFLEKFFGGR